MPKNVTMPKVSMKGMEAKSGMGDGMMMPIKNAAMANKRSFSGSPTKSFKTGGSVAYPGKNKVSYPNAKTKF